MTEPQSSDSRTCPPGPRGLPLIGSTLSIIRDPLKFVESARAYGDIVAYEAYGTEFAIVYDPHIVESVLVSRAGEFRKGEFETEFGELVAPQGVAFTEGERWRRQRELLQSSFTPDRIRSYADEMVAEAAALAEGWDGGDAISLRDAMSGYTLDVLGRTLFDLPLEGEHATVVRRAATALNEYASPRRLALESVRPSWLPSSAKREYEAAMADLGGLVADLVDERRREDAAGTDLLSVLARAKAPDGSKLPPEEIRDQLVTFLFAGHETTATTLAVACWLLASTPGVRTAVETELEAVCSGRGPTIRDLADLEYVEAVLRESMRLYPPITGVYREPLEDVVLSGYRIPAGTTLQLSAYGIHRDKRWWPDPETSRPNRWLEDDGRPEYAFFPFGGGPRHCLGMRFAMVELKLALATLARQVRFEPKSGSFDPSLGVTLDPGPLLAHIQKK